MQGNNIWWYCACTVNILLQKICCTHNINYNHNIKLLKISTDLTQRESYDEGFDCSWINKRTIYMDFIKEFIIIQLLVSEETLGLILIYLQTILHNNAKWF